MCQHVCSIKPYVKLFYLSIQSALYNMPHSPIHISTFFPLFYVSAI